MQNSSVHDILSEIRKRISFYDIFKLFDTQKVNEIEIDILKKENEEMTQTINLIMSMNREQQK